MSEQKVLSTEYPFRGRIFTVRVDTVGERQDDARRIEIVQHGGSYGIIAQDAQERIILVRQTRYAVKRTLWELPAGTAEEDENALAGAQRELAEETGYRASSWQRLGTLFMTPGFCDEVMHFFYATQLQAGEQSLDEDEDIEVCAVGLSEAQQMIVRGEIADAKTVLAIGWVAGSRYQLGPQTSDT